MTREEEDALLAEMHRIQRRSSVLIQRIVDARMNGSRDDDAVAEMGWLSKRRVALTRPVFDPVQN